MTDVVENLLRAALLECCPPALVTGITNDDVFTTAVEDCTLDLHAFVAKDPASRGCTLSVAQGASSYRAVTHYRLAHALLGAKFRSLHGPRVANACRADFLPGKTAFGCRDSSSLCDRKAVRARPRLGHCDW
jgi:hypothetical protein